MHAYAVFDFRSGGHLSVNNETSQVTGRNCVNIPMIHQAPVDCVNLHIGSCFDTRFAIK